MIAGMDFGTTNSGMAVYDGQELRILPLDAANDNPRVFRTALYITNEQEVVVGREALDQYFAHNVGRPVKLKKVWVGEIEVIADAFEEEPLRQPNDLTIDRNGRIYFTDRPILSTGSPQIGVHAV